MYEIINPPVLSIQICDLSLGRDGYIVPTSSMYQGDTQPIVEFDWERILVYKREREREYHFISQRDHVIGRTTAMHCCINTAHRMLCDARNGTRQHMGGKIPFRRGIPVLMIFVRFTHGQNLSFVKVYLLSHFHNRTSMFRVEEGGCSRPNLANFTVLHGPTKFTE